MIDGKIDYSKYEQEAKPIDIRYYLVKYSRYWPLYSTCIFIALVVVFLFHRYAVEEYEVRGSVLIKEKNSPETRILDRSNIFSGTSNLENDILLFTSKNLAEEALRKLHFEVSYYASTNIKEVELYDKSPIRVEVDKGFPYQESGTVHFTMVSEDAFTLTREDKSILDFMNAKANGPFDEEILNKTYRFDEWIESSRSRFKVNKIKNLEPGDKLFFVIHNPADILDRYAKSVVVRPVNNLGTVLQVSMVSQVVEKGRDYVNALMDSFIEHDLRVKNRMSENTLRFIDEQMYVLSDSLKVVEQQMLNFKVENKLLDVNSEFGGVLGNIQSMEDMVQQIEFQLSYYKSLQSYLEKKSKDYSDIIAPSIVGIEDGFLNTMVGKLVEASLERRKLLAVVNENHPNVAQLDEQISKLRENIFENIDNLVTNTERRKAEAQKKMKELNQDFARLPKTESDYTNIYRQYRLRDNLYNYLLEKRAEAGIAKASNVPDNSVLDYARRGALIFPKRTQNYGLAFGLGFFIPLAFLVAYHYFNNRIMDQIQLRNSIRMPLLGTIGYSSKDTNMLVAEHPKSMVSESFRSLRSALFYIASEKKCKKILLTSSVSGEGKTFASLNLSAAMALSGKKTCLIGMDLRKPKIAEYVGLANEKGLSSYLVDRATKEEIVLKTKYDNLFLVPSGPIPPNPAELLLKDKMKEFLAYLEQEFEVVIMDTPPIGLVSETMDLLRFSDVNIYIVRQDYTRKKYLLMINDLYANDQVRDFYAVFNGIRAGGDVYDFGGYNYGYGYNYSYMRKNKYTGNYYEMDEEKAAPKQWLKKMMDRFRA
jgi:capsular exopolysaccharide synthesis family protein